MSRTGEEALRVGLLDDDELAAAGAPSAPESVADEWRASSLSHVTFSWLFPLLRLGATRALESADLGALAPCDGAALNADKLAHLCEASLKLKADDTDSGADADALVATFAAAAAADAAGSSQARLLRALVVSEPAMVWAGLCMFVGGMLGFAGPLALNGIVNYVSLHAAGSRDASWGPAGISLELGQWWVIALLASSLLQALLLHQHHHLSMRAGMHVRSAVMALVFRKATRISPRARAAYGVGLINNLVQQDATAIGLVFWYIHYSWNAPLQLAVCMWLLYQQLGVSAFVALAVLIGLIPLQGRLSAALGALAKSTLAFSDARVKLVNEIFGGVRILKLQAWEVPFAAKLTAARESELAAKLRVALLGALNSTLLAAAPLVVALLTFVAFGFASSVPLTAAEAFSALAYFSILRLPLMVIPMLVGVIAAARASLTRIAAFLDAPDAVDYRLLITSGAAEDGAAVVFEKASLSWPPAATSAAAEGADEVVSPPTLHSISLSIPAGKLTAIVGSVGSGKSSLLAAVLGEMELASGCVRVASFVAVAFVSQQAFVLNATIRDNILFGEPTDDVRYARVLDACALRPDLAILPAGDQTEVGERGVTLSGGQRARVSLARALFSRSALVLLDDPLSAVDAHTAAHLVQHALKGPDMRGRTVVVATHQLGLALPFTDLVVVLREGRVALAGPFSELIAGHDPLLRSMMHGGGAVGPSSSTVAGAAAALSQEHVSGATPVAQAVAVAVNVAAAAATSPKAAGALVSEEDRDRGSVPLSVYGAYLLSLTPALLAVIAAALLVSNASTVASGWWLGIWSTDALGRGVGFYIAVYAGLSCASMLLAGFYNTAFALGGVAAARAHHAAAFTRVLRAPVLFFDTTPLGRVINRFSGDVAIVDKDLPASFASYANLLTSISCNVIVQAVVLPFTLAASVPLGAVYVWIQSFYRQSSRELRRLDAISKSPVFATLSETLSGLPTIRAFAVRGRFVQAFERQVDHNARASLKLNFVNRWLGLRLDVLGSLLVCVTALVAVWTAGSISAGLIGLALSFAISITGLLNWLVRGSTETETSLSSIQRLQFFAALETEAPAIVLAHRPAPSWPAHGAVAFRGVVARYRPELEPVLRDVSFVAEAGQRIGVCGRTGSGKSSMMLCLFRILECEAGVIEIDGINIASIGLEDLRSRLAVIPQEPTLFSGSLRYNLDPFDRHSDAELSDVLARVDLSAAVAKLGGLGGAVSEGGENLSVGQRQLVCLARALLRRARVLVLDEATASVDSVTDSLIQRMLREAFKGATVLIVAHRIDTILDCDRVLVLDRGEVGEFGPPQELLARGGLFAKLVEGDRGSRGRGAAAQ